MFATRVAPEASSSKSRNEPPTSSSERGTRVGSSSSIPSKSESLAGALPGGALSAGIGWVPGTAGTDDTRAGTTDKTWGGFDELGGR